MRRRSLFAGLAGLLAAPKVPAAAPAFGHPTHWSPWIVGDTVDFAAGGLIREDAWALGVMGNGDLEAIVPLERTAVQRVTMTVAVEGLDGILAAADALAEKSAPLTPIGVAWSGYTDDVRAAAAPSLVGGARAAEGTASFLSAAHQLSVGSFHAAQLAAGAAALASESHPEK